MSDYQTRFAPFRFLRTNAAPEHAHGFAKKLRSTIAREIEMGHERSRFGTSNWLPAKSFRLSSRFDVNRLGGFGVSARAVAAQRISCHGFARASRRSSLTLRRNVPAPFTPASRAVISDNTIATATRSRGSISDGDVPPNLSMNG